ncbi:MAG: TRAP transporter permease [Eubacteriales bacterium]|nr:TRAP transporter permease [Eubacteriales bacterium]
MSEPKEQARTANAIKPTIVVDSFEVTQEEAAQLEAAAVLEKYDKESAFRNRLPKPLNTLIGIVLIVFSLFQLYSTVFTLPVQQLRPIHLGFVLFLVYLLYPAKRSLGKGSIPWYDWALALLSLACMLYLPLNYSYIVRNVGNLSYTDVTVGVLGMLLLFEACRRVVGLPILIIVCIFLAYAFFGNLIPGIYGIRQMGLRQVITHMYYTTNGVFGTPLGVSATFIFLFVLFGAFLEKTGVGRLFIDIANAIAGKYVGGPAKVAVIASALEGTVSGSSVANTVGSGAFTIPAMKRLGYKPEFAAAVEAAASTGGQIMPPIMGAAAFLMAESTGFSYASVVKSAVIPAILYFSGILISVHHEAKKIGLRGMPPEEIPHLGAIVKERSYLMLALALMIYMLSSRVTPSYAALGAILTALMSCSLRWWSLVPIAGMVACMNLDLNFTQYAPWVILLWLLMCPLVNRKRGVRVADKLGFDPMDILDALKVGARSALSVAVACAMAGIIVGTVTLTGLGLKMANGLASLAGNNIYLLMFFTMLASIVLGMGVPTTANYLITSTICAPALINLACQMRGVPTGVDAPMAIIMSAHLFVFYFGIVADITPPVALAAMAGSAIAKSDPMKTGITATRLAIGAFVVPYIFMMDPSMLMIDAAWYTIVFNVCTALLGMYALSGGLTAYFQDSCRWYECVLLALAGLLMIIPGWETDLCGFIIAAALFVLQRRRRERRTRVTAAQ